MDGKTETRTIRVVDENGEVWPNLWGVFDRVFPIVVGQVLHDGQPQAVTYHGDRFTIEIAS